MPTPDNPLQIPEIVSAVLQHADNKTLVAAAQVNSLWAEYATDNIWRGQASTWEGYCIADALLRLVDSCSNDDERLHWYMRKIRHVWINLIDGNERFKALLRQGKFAFLNARSMGIYVWGLEERCLGKLLTSKVVALRLFSPFEKEILDEIKTRCPSLRLLLVTWPDCFTPGQFLHFLTHMPSITHIDTDHNSLPLSDRTLLHHIALRPNLEALGYITSAIFEPLASGNTILSSLQHLNVTLQPEHEKYILPALSTLKHLRSLTLDQRFAGLATLLDCLSLSCPVLEEFTAWGVHTAITGPGLARLARGCPSLRTLNMLTGSERDYTFTDASIDEIASSLPALEFFRLYRKLPLLSIASLLAFARHCPHLHTLEIQGTFALTSLPESVSFPSLHALSIDHTIPPISRRRTSVDRLQLDRRRERVIAVLEARFPVLREFEMSAGKENAFYARVKRHLDERAESRGVGCEDGGRIGMGVKEVLEKRLFWGRGVVDESD